MSDERVIPPSTPVSPQEAALLTQLQGYFNVPAAADRLRTYAQWLFTTASVVGTLAAGFAASQARGGFFFVGIAVLGFSLAAAGKALAPRWTKDVNPLDLRSMLESAGKDFASRRVWLQVASFCFAVAITIGGLTPLVSYLFQRPKEPQINVAYSTDEKGVLTLKATGKSPTSDAVLSLKVETDPASIDKKPTRGQQPVDATGTAVIDLKKDLTDLHGTLVVTAQWSTGTSIRLTIPLLPASNVDQTATANSDKTQTNKSQATKSAKK